MFISQSRLTWHPPQQAKILLSYQQLFPDSGLLTLFLITVSVQSPLDLHRQRGKTAQIISETTHFHWLNLHSLHKSVKILKAMQTGSHLLLKASWDSAFLAVFICTARLQLKHSCSRLIQIQEEQHKQREHNTQLSHEKNPSGGKTGMKIKGRGTFESTVIILASFMARRASAT